MNTYAGYKLEQLREQRLEQALKECMEAYKSTVLSEFETRTNRTPHINEQWLEWESLLAEKQATSPLSSGTTDTNCHSDK